MLLAGIPQSALDTPIGSTTHAHTLVLSPHWPLGRLEVGLTGDRHLVAGRGRRGAAMFVRGNLWFGLSLRPGRGQMALGPLWRSCSAALLIQSPIRAAGGRPFPPLLHALHPFRGPPCTLGGHPAPPTLLFKSCPTFKAHPEAPLLWEALP